STSPTVGTLTMRRGALIGNGNVNLTVSDLFHWSNGVLSGTAMSSGQITVGRMLIDEGSLEGHSLGTSPGTNRILINTGIATWIGGDISIGAGTVFDNQGTFIAQTNGAISGPGQFLNEELGTFRAAALSGITSVYAPFTNSGLVQKQQTSTLNFFGGFTHTGSVQVQGGTMNLLGGGVSSAGFTMDAGAT